VFKSGVAPFRNLSPSSFSKRDTGEELKISEASRYTYRVYKRDEVPLSQTLPLPLFKGKGDKGGWGYQIKA